MSKAEDRALEKYPVEMYEEVGWRCIDKNVNKRKYFVKGYHQAEKDLELGWEDVKMLQDISSTVYAEVAQGSVDYYQIYPTEQSFLEEVLKRFKERKNNL